MQNLIWALAPIGIVVAGVLLLVGVRALLKASGLLVSRVRHAAGPAQAEPGPVVDVDNSPEVSRDGSS